MVTTAPTMVRSCAMLGRPLSLGVMLMSIGTGTGAWMRAVARSNMTGLLKRTDPPGCGCDGWVRQSGVPGPPTGVVS